MIQSKAVDPDASGSAVEMLQAVGDDNGIKVADEVNGANVSAKVLKNGKEKKVIVYKMKPKKGYRKKQGHRQGFTRVMISKIRTSAKKSASEETAAE